MKQPIIYHLVDTAGEISAIVTSPIGQKSLVKAAVTIMKVNNRIEQVGFLDPYDAKTDCARFRMMGEELSVNGLVAGAGLLMKRQKQTSIMLRSSIMNNLITATLNNDFVNLQFPRSIVRSEINNTITFKGLTFLLLPSLPSTSIVSLTQKQLLRKLAADNPASGLIYYQGSRIAPLLYVRATNSYVWEQSCGSGSIAYALYSGRKRIKQPSGEHVSTAITNSNINYRTKAYIYKQTREVLI